MSLKRSPFATGGYAPAGNPCYCACLLNHALRSLVRLHISLLRSDKTNAAQRHGPCREHRHNRSVLKKDRGLRRVLTAPLALRHHCSAGGGM